MAELASPMEKRKGRWAQLPIMRRDGGLPDESDAEDFRQAIQAHMTTDFDVVLVGEVALTPHPVEGAAIERNCA